MGYHPAACSGVLNIIHVLLTYLFAIWKVSYSLVIDVVLAKELVGRLEILL